MKLLLLYLCFVYDDMINNWFKQRAVKIGQVAGSTLQLEAGEICCALYCNTCSNFVYGTRVMRQ